MTAAGFTHRADITADHVPPAHTEAGGLVKLYFQNKPGARRSHVHVRMRGAQNQRFTRCSFMTTCARPEAAAALAEIKRQLAAPFPTTRTVTTRSGSRSAT